MPTYPYECMDCKTKFEVTKRVADIDLVEFCTSCSGEGRRTISTSQYFYGAGDWNKEEYNPAFGCVVKGSKHRARLAKERGWTEVGNEDPVKIGSEMDRDRERALDAAWEKV